MLTRGSTAQADAISRSTTDAALLRHGFLHNIAHHRELVAAWAAQAAKDRA